MAKKKATERNKTKKPLNPIIEAIPKHSQQRRSSTPKRRTDFSLFLFSDSSSSSNSGSSLENSCIKTGLFDKNLNTLHSINAEGRELFPSCLVRCNTKSFDEVSGFSPNSSDTSIALLESDGDRKVDELTSDNLGVLGFTPKKSLVGNTMFVSPASVTSDKTCRIWLPSVDLRTMSSRELMVKNGSASSSNSDEHDLSSDKCTLSVSSRIDDDSVERGRGKRERKPKVHFDDVSISIPLKPDGQVRRLRIMRYLGLTPPIGSPF